MNKNNVKILILESQTAFRNRLRDLCEEVGKVWVCSDLESVLSPLTQYSFDLLLMDWDLIYPEFHSFSPMLDNLQPDARRVALLKAPQLNDVVSAMKSGMTDVLWAGQDAVILEENIKDALEQEPECPVVHAYISKLAETLADKAMTRKISLFQARKEFSNVFLRIILKQQKMKRTQLAELMDITSRTLQRHLQK